MSTYFPKANDVKRQWFLVDATGVAVGRLSTTVADVLSGKNKPTWTPFLDTGDHVIVINADKIVLTKGKSAKEMVYRYSGYPGGLKSETYQHLLERDAAEAVRRSVRGMLPHGPLGRQQIKKLKVYAGAQHPHTAQNPVILELPAAKAR